MQPWALPLNAASEQLVTPEDITVQAQPTTTRPTAGLVVTIDGPAGAGKSSVAHKLADQLGFDFLDTGAMYRCVTLAVLRRGIETNDEPSVLALADQLSIEVDGATVHLNGEDVSEAIRTPQVATAIGRIADNVAVRRLLSRLQREWTVGRRVVTEGRDQGSEVFHDSPCKIFLVAGSDERARRRHCELAARGIELELATVLEQQNQRDLEDRSRPVGGLRKAADAIEVSTDGKTLDGVVAELRSVVVERLQLQPSDLPINAGEFKNDGRMLDGGESRLQCSPLHSAKGQSELS